MRCPLLCLVLLVVHVAWGVDYVTYRPGNMTLILTVANGGSEKPDEFTNRDHGCYITENKSCVYVDCAAPDSSKCRVGLGRDSRVQDIVDDVAKYIQSNVSRTPHIITNNLHKVKLDPDSEIGEGAQGDEKAITQYNIFHNYVRQAINNLNGEKVILIDVHGQSSEVDLNRISFGLTAFDITNRRNLAGTSTIRRLLDEKCCSNVSCRFEYMSGTKSFGASLGDVYDVVPSIRNPSPTSSKYSSGGYIIKTYGSANGGGTDAIQIQIPKQIRFSQSARPKFAEDLGRAIIEFMKINGYLQM